MKNLRTKITQIVIDNVMTEIDNKGQEHYKMNEEQLGLLIDNLVKKLNADDVSSSLEIPEIRNKLSPITHLIWCAENERGQKHIEKAIPQAKKSVNYLAQREVYYH